MTHEAALLVSRGPSRPNLNNRIVSLPNLQNWDLLISTPSEVLSGESREGDIGRFSRIGNLATLESMISGIGAN